MIGKYKQRTTRLIIGLFFLATALSAPANVMAAPYRAERTLISAAPTTLRESESLIYRVSFKNTGTTNWSSTGKERVTIKTTEAIKKEHWFASQQWLDKLTVAPVSPNIIRPGEVGFFTLPLEAPQRAAKFTLYFAAFVGTEKISGTDFNISITVTNKTFSPSTANKPTSAPAIGVLTPATTMGATSLRMNAYLKTSVLLRSAPSLSLNAGESTTFTVGFKNTGERNWRNTAPSLITLVYDPASAGSTSFKDPSWTSDTVVTAQPTAIVNPGEISFVTFRLLAPQTSGQYQPEFRLVMNGDTLVDGSRFSIPVGVASAPPAHIPTTTNTPVVPMAGNSIVCIAAEDIQNPGENGTGLCQPRHEEPILRVGIAPLEGQLGVTADIPYVIEDNTGKSYMRVSSGIVTFLAYSASEQVYTAVGPGPVVRSPLPLRIRGADAAGIITLTTFKNPVAYNAGWNDNSYRGTVEIRWSEKDKKVWIINELPMEDYLKGLAESSNAAHSEYQKTLVIAARSYALYHHETSSKHRARYFDVVATVSDQYYRGYESEKRIPKLTEAVAATRGQVVTYQGSVAITPYSASSNGMTKTWEEVWGGRAKPWLIRKAVPWDTKRQKFGHAVGLSQMAANDMAKEGWNYIDILKFFYINTDIAQWYK